MSEELTDAEVEAALRDEVESSGWTLKSIEWAEPEGFEGYRNYEEVCAMCDRHRSQHDDAACGTFVPDHSR